MIGSYGNRWANLALGRCDLLLVLGSRLDVRQTGADLSGFVRGKKLIRVDIDDHELRSKHLGGRDICCDVGEFLRAVSDAGGEAPDRGPWLAEIAELRGAWPDEAEYTGRPGINPARFMSELSRASGAAAAYVVDVGQNQMWAAQSLRLRHDQHFITSGGMGAMGFALPAAIGVALSAGGRPVVVISGDGGFQVNLQELETVRRLDSSVKMVVLNNHSLGMVRQFQDELLASRYQSTVVGYGTPDFVAVAKAFGLPARRIAGEVEIGPALEWLWSDRTSAALLEVEMDPDSCISPKILFGNPVYRMTPRRQRGGGTE